MNKNDDGMGLEIRAKFLGSYLEGQRDFFNFRIFVLNIKQNFTHTIDKTLFVFFIHDYIMYSSYSRDELLTIKDWVRYCLMAKKACQKINLITIKNNRGKLIYYEE